MNSILRSSQLRQLVNKSPIRSLATTSSCADSFKVQDEKDFSEKIENSKEPVIVDFFANWCGPCKALEPRLANVLAKRQGISLAKVDIDDFAEVAAKYDVGSIPALVVFRNGKVEERLVGLQDEDKLGLWVDKVLQKK